jgi:hypothetical protein
VCGLIAWYAGARCFCFRVSLCILKRTNLRHHTGNGSGSGNPYGAAAAFGVVVLPLIFLRVFAPEPYLAGNVMCCVSSIHKCMNIALIDFIFM